jgi:muramidase (phage lysozyme)
MKVLGQALETCWRAVAMLSSSSRALRHGSVDEVLCRVCGIWAPVVFSGVEQR